ncbi:YigZ family protein [Collinsella sp. AGMB00827]|uniref:YigZ family protein n=1 Tax=Collinsella ureilytica TaxID=2869515 RepID=A0ABS7MKM3_9ACTN|nr:YigZ family protein [Collinsella urealyticum]
MEAYKTLRPGTRVCAELQDRRSRFIAEIAHVSSEEEAAAHLAGLRSAHHAARHHVPAWILADGTERASDDGEPQRTSGMPTLEVLRGYGLRDISCVTVRYFGGVLLGPGGLVRAYAGAARAAIEQAESEQMIIEMCPVAPVALTLEYADHARVLDLVERLGGKVVRTDYSDKVQAHLHFHAGHEQAFLMALREALAGNEQAQVEPVCFTEF